MALQYIAENDGPEPRTMNTRHGIVVIDQWHIGPRTLEDRVLILAIRLGLKYLRNVCSGRSRFKGRGTNNSRRQLPCDQRSKYLELD